MTTTYDLAYIESGVAADQKRIVQSGELATVRARYFLDGHPRTSSFGRAPLVAGGYTVLFNPLQTPTARTEYVLSPANTIWMSVFFGDASTFDAAVGDGWRRYPTGAIKTVDWLHPALLPGFAAPTAADRLAPDTLAYDCPACRVDDELSLRMSALTDSTPGHAGSLDIARPGHTNARLQLFQDGRLVDDETNTSAVMVAVDADASEYRLLFHLDTGTTLSRDSSTTTDLHFRSASGQGPALPSGWTCAGLAAGSACRALPILSVRAPLPVDLNAQMTNTDSHTMYVTVSHVPGAADIPITALRIVTRIDGKSCTKPAANELQ